MNVDGTPQRTVVARGQIVDLIDQRLLPHRFERLHFDSVEGTAAAIETMVVRGAGAIGATAAAGMAQAAVLSLGGLPAIHDAAARLRRTRPTAQNLFYAVERMLTVIEAAPADSRVELAMQEATAIADEDAWMCEQIGLHGSALLTDGMQVATHCNAGWLAFVDWGSALAPIYQARRQGKQLHVWVDETRPRGQGAQLTAWELAHEGVPHHVIPDNALASRMALGQVDLMITGADRVAANGDVANKIGTYSAALCARAHGIPFYVALPSSTLDANTPTGAGIPIEERDEHEVSHTWGELPDGRFGSVRTTLSPCFNPAFDITPAALVTGYITERGVLEAHELYV